MSHNKHKNKNGNSTGQEQTGHVFKNLVLSIFNFKVRWLKGYKMGSRMQPIKQRKYLSYHLV